MRLFTFKLYVRTAQQQEFNTATKTIQAKNYDEARKQFSKLDLPFHHFSTVESKLLTP